MGRDEINKLIHDLRWLGSQRAEASGDMMYRDFSKESTAEWKAADILAAQLSAAPAAE